MHRFLFSLILIFTNCAQAEVDPCKPYDYPIKWQSQLTHLKSSTRPAIFSKKNNSKIVISKSDAIEIVQTNMSEHKPYLKKAKKHIINSLSTISANQLVDDSTFWISFDGLEQEELNVAIHVMAGFQDLFEHALLDKKASVYIGNKLRLKTNAKYMVGRFPEDKDGLTYVHKLIVSSSDNIVFSKCSVKVVDSAEVLMEPAQSRDTTERH